MRAVISGASCRPAVANATARLATWLGTSPTRRLPWNTQHTARWTGPVLGLGRPILLWTVALVHGGKHTPFWVICWGTHSMRSPGCASRKVHTYHTTQHAAQPNTRNTHMWPLRRDGPADPELRQDLRPPGVHGQRGEQRPVHRPRARDRAGSTPPPTHSPARPPPPGCARSPGPAPATTL